MTVLKIHYAARACARVSLSRNIRCVPGVAIITDVMMADRAR
jgi:hypothetical protein